MPRIRIQKDFDDKKTSITLAALNIILEEGVGSFSVNYLLRKIKMSKGSFFHYFDSKEDLLSSVFDFASESIIDNMHSIMKDENLNPKEKFIRLYQSVGGSKAGLGKGFESLTEVLLNNDNKLFISEVMDRTMKACLPIFEELISEGVRSGDFNTEHPHAAAFHILTITMRLNSEIGTYLLSGQKDNDKREILEKISLGEKIVCSILGSDMEGMLYRKETLILLGIV